MRPQESQERTLTGLLNKAADTEFGRTYGFAGIPDYRSFREKVPVHLYKDIEASIEQIKQGKKDLFWPGTVTNFAVSAGTTGKGKHLPLTDDRLNSDKRFMRKVVWSYFRQRPNPLRVVGKQLSLPGSLEIHDSYRLGEVSGFSAYRSPLLLRPLQLVNPRKLTQLPFQQKFDLAFKEAIAHPDLKVIIAVPSWVLTLFQRALRETGKASIQEIWPKLRLIVAGGVKLENYRPHIEKLAGDLPLDFIENYGASEGYFGYSDDLQRDDLRLMTGNGIFYEFIPHPSPDKDKLAGQETVPLWEVEAGVPYCLAVSTNAGLWRYSVNDIIEFTSVDPPRIKVRGRLSEMLDDFGEAVYAFEAEEALKKAAGELNIKPGNFTICGELKSESSVPRHHWFVQFTQDFNDDALDRLAQLVDRNLQQINRHYAIRRESDALDAPRFYEISQQDINDWFSIKNKDKAQSKLPKIITEREDVDFFLKREKG